MYFLIFALRKESSRFLCIQSATIRSKTKRSVKSMVTQNCDSFFNITKVFKCACPKDKVKGAKCESVKKVYSLQVRAIFFATAPSFEAREAHRY